jgi:hypothetical protein
MDNEMTYVVFKTEDFEAFEAQNGLGRVPGPKSDELGQLFEANGDGDYTVIEIAGRARPKVVTSLNFETARKRVRKAKLAEGDENTEAAEGEAAPKKRGRKPRQEATETV